MPVTVFLEALRSQVFLTIDGFQSDKNVTKFIIMRKKDVPWKRVPETCPTLLRRWLLEESSRLVRPRLIIEKAETRLWRSCRRVMDVGCGTGVFAYALSRAYPHLRVTGVDSSPAFINYARSRFRESNLDFRQTSVYELPLGPQKCDAIVLKFSLHHMNRLSAALIRISRVLAPGGVVVIIDFDRELCSRWRMLRRWRCFRGRFEDRDFARRLVDGRLVLNGWRVTVPMALALDSALAAYTVAEIAQAAAKCGLGISRCEFFALGDGIFPPRFKGTYRLELAPLQD